VATSAMMLQGFRSLQASLVTSTMLSALGVGASVTAPTTPGVWIFVVSWSLPTGPSMVTTGIPAALAAVTHGTPVGGLTAPSTIPL
jgi:hypothetical protein